MAPQITIKIDSGGAYYGLILSKLRCRANGRANFTIAKTDIAYPKTEGDSAKTVRNAGATSISAEGETEQIARPNCVVISIVSVAAIVLGGLIFLLGLNRS